MRLKDLLEETKLVAKIRAGKNKSFKCDTLKEFLDSIKELEDTTSTIIADVIDRVVYVVGRSSFHTSLAKEWHLPKSSDDRYLHFIGNFSDNGFSVDKLQMSNSARNIIKSLDTKNWIRRLI